MKANVILVRTEHIPMSVDLPDDTADADAVEQHLQSVLERLREANGGVAFEFIQAEHDAGFGDERACVCGHPYRRHFDTYDDIEEELVGCKYCDCCCFVEKALTRPPAPQS